MTEKEFRETLILIDQMIDYIRRKMSSDKEGKFPAQYPNMARVIQNSLYALYCREDVTYITHTMGRVAIVREGLNAATKIRTRVADIESGKKKYREDELWQKGWMYLFAIAKLDKTNINRYGSAYYPTITDLIEDES